MPTFSDEGLLGGLWRAEVVIGQGGCDASAWGPVDEPLLQEVGFEDIFESVLLFAEGCGEGF